MHLTIGGKQTSGPSLGEKDQKNLEGSLKVFSQGGNWSDEFFFYSNFFTFNGRTHRGSHPRSSNHCVCYGGCTHTNLLHEHFSGVRTLRVHFAHSYACHTHAWLNA